MISFDLQCTNGHSFEGWFDDNDAFEKQKKADLVSCPVCNDSNIFKVPSTFAIKKSSGPAPAKDPKESKLTPEAIGHMQKYISDYVEKNFDDVGSGFTTEALKMHYGVTDPRNIKGTSTDAEEKILADEGIKFTKIPVFAKPKGEA